MKPITENHIEQYAIEELQALGYGYVYGPEIEREDFGQVVLIENLRRQVAVINPDIPDEAREQAVQKVLRIFSPDLLTNNEQFHQLEKIKVPYTQDGFERSHEVALIDFGNIENNDFLAVNQFTVTHNNRSKRIDVLLFVNGIPLVLMELKNATGETATIRSAFDQVQTYKALIPTLFNYNVFSVISDGFEAKAGTLSAGYSRFMAWKSIDGDKEAWSSATARE